MLPYKQANEKYGALRNKLSFYIYSPMDIYNVNVEADALSRGLFNIFQATAPTAQRIPCPLPAQIAFNSPLQPGIDHRP